MNEQIFKIDLNQTRKIKKYNIKVKTCLTLEEMEIIINNNINRNNYLERKIMIIYNILLLICPDLFKENTENYKKIQDYVSNHKNVTEQEAEKILKITYKNMNYEDILYNGLWDAIITECPNIKKGYNLIQETIDNELSINNSFKILVNDITKTLAKLNNKDIKLDSLVNAIKENIVPLIEKE